MKPYAYSLENDEGTEIFPSFEKMYRRLISDNVAWVYKAKGYYTTSIGIHFENESKGVSNEFFNSTIRQIQITPEQMQNIEDRVDAEIQANEKYLNTLTHTITGSSLVTSRDRPVAINNEVFKSSFEWVPFEELPANIEEIL